MRSIKRKENEFYTGSKEEREIVLIPACIGINYLGKLFASVLKSPLWLDSITFMRIIPSTIKSKLLKLTTLESTTQNIC